MLKLISIVAYVGMAGSVAWLLVTRNLFSPAPVLIILQVVALLLLVWARVTFGRRSLHVVANPTEGGLVTSGPYRYIRHPIYAALCLFTGATLIAHRSWQVVLCVGLVFSSSLIRIFCEETLVGARYPEYKQYAARTWRMIPFIF